MPNRARLLEMPLKAFYPEVRLRHQVHYHFVHRFLPAYVHDNPRAFFAHVYDDTGSPLWFIQSRWQMMESIIGTTSWNARVIRHIADLEVWCQEIHDRPEVFLQMPSPERAPLAFFVGIVLLAPGMQPETWPEDTTARFVTLERRFEADDETGLLCEWTRDGRHINFGTIVPAQRASFEAAVALLLQSRGLS